MVNTNSQSLEAVTRDGIVVNGKEYAVDVIMRNTGFNANGGFGDPATRGGMEIVGRNGRLLKDMLSQETPKTLHTLMSGGFPNFFLLNSQQGGVPVVLTYQMQQMTIHAMYILKTAFEHTRQSSVTDSEPRESGDRAHP